MTDQRNCVHIWWADLTLAHSSLRNCVSGAEADRAASYSGPADQGRSLLAAALLRAAAATALGVDPADLHVDRTCEECGKPHGKPVVAGVEVSVSHAGLLVVVAVGSIPVGIDVERVSDLADSGFDGGVAKWCAAEARTKLGVHDLSTCQHLDAPLPGYGACLAVAAQEPVQIVQHDVAASAQVLQGLCRR